jgi:hypothetical protein
MYDWNGNGKYDEQDAFIDYQIYHDCSNNQGTPHRSSSNGMSTFGAILCTVGGFIGAALIIALLGIEDVPGLLIVVLWVVVSVILSVFVGKIGL